MRQNWYMKKIQTNEKIAHVLREMSLLYEMEEEEFKPRAYEKAALSVESLDEPVADIYKEGGTRALDGIPGVGAGIAEHMEALLTGKHFREYERLKKKMPVDVEALSAVEGVGPKTIRILWKKLKIKTLADLLRAAKKGKIAKLPGFGRKTEEKILQGITFLKSSGGRRVLGFVLPDIAALEKKITDFPEVKEAVVAGSVRRMKETIGDIDLLVVSEKPEKTADRFVKLPQVAHVYGKGKTKINVKLKNGLDADVRIIPKRSWGAALNYFTGSKAHNVELRRIALKKGYKLNEYGLFKGKKMIAGGTEEGLYRALGLAPVPPELREMTGEIEAAKKKKLPALVDYGDLMGDLQVQTNWTDGKHPILHMARAAAEAGLRYIAITDHTRDLAMVGGLDEKKLTKQRKEIDAVNKKLKQEKINMTVLSGVEANIRKDGTLDVSDAALAKLDVVGAAVHSHFNLSKKAQTARIVRAMENPHVDIIFHLTTRLINRRKPIDIATDEIVAAAKRTKTVLEIDAYPDRLDIDDSIVKKCVEKGVKMSVDSDAHAAEHYIYLKFGIGQARRGFAAKKDIINAWPLAKMKKSLK